MQSSSLVLHLMLERGSRLAGVVVSDDGVGPLPFSGWLGLVEVVEMCRRTVQADLSVPDPAGQEGEGPCR